MRKLTPLMIELLRWYASRLTGKPEAVRHVSGVRLATTVGLIDRGLLTPRMPSPDGFSDHALTTAGLAYLIKTEPDGELRRNCARQLIKDAAHIHALAYLRKIDFVGEDINAVQAEYVSLRAEAAAALVAAERVDRIEDDFPLTQGPKPMDAATNLCGIDSGDGQTCTRPQHLGRALPGNHSWAPVDLAPSTTAVQRDAYAADRQHEQVVADGGNRPAAGTCTFVGLVSKRPCILPAGHALGHDIASATAEDAEPQGTQNPFWVHGADRRWTYVGPGGLFRVGEDVEPAVYATASRVTFGRFTIRMLGRIVADVVRAPDGCWRPVD
jgi:hypothetical protein